MKRNVTINRVVTGTFVLSAVSSHAGRSSLREYFCKMPMAPNVGYCGTVTIDSGRGWYGVDLIATGL